MTFRQKFFIIPIAWLIGLLCDLGVILAIITEVIPELAVGLATNNFKMRLVRLIWNSQLNNWARGIMFFG